jgi:hypothetical protein
MKRERAAAISAVGLMLIAGCSGGRSVGTTAPSLPGVGQQPGTALVNGARATLQIMLPEKALQSAGRRGGASTRRSTSTLRHPAWVSPASYFVGLDVVPANGGPAYPTSFYLSTCSVGTNAYGAYYNCALSVPYGSDVFYVSMYDASGYLLSTNQFASPTPQMVYPNGSPYTNYISVYEQGVLSTVEQASPVFCFAAGHPQAIPLYFVDADGYSILGPLANPLTPTFAAYDGAGFGAISLYANYNGSYVSVNNQTLYDTTVYTSPYFWVSGREGAITISATVANIPVYTNGSYATYTPYGGIAATGTYIAWGIDNIGPSGGDLYPIAIQTTLSPSQAVVCQSANVGSGGFLYVGSILSSGYPYLVAADSSNTVHLFDAEVTANANGHSYAFFQTSSSYGRPGPQSLLYETAHFTTTYPFVDFFTSSVTPGRIDVLSSSRIDLVDTTSGLISSDQSYLTSVAMVGGTRVAGSTVSHVLYYDEPGTPNLYGISAGGYPSTPLTGVGAINGQLYSLAPSGGSGTYIFVRGANASGSYYVCEFDSSNFSAGTYCAPITSTDANPASMTFDPGSGEVVWATGGTTAYAFNALTPPPSFTTTAAATTVQITLPHSALRVLGSAGTPGIVGFYGGPLTCTVSPYTTNSGEITWMQYNGSSWAPLGSLCWPNHYITLTYP